MNQPLIYLDYAATTPVDPQVAARMADYLTSDGCFANPASRSHLLGWLAEEAVENARNEVADLIGADNREIIWTSGATESNNLAIKGIAANFSPKDCHLIIAATEHKAVLDPARYLASQGYELTLLEPNSLGLISADQVAEALQPNTRLVSVMAVNNETGVINPMADIGALCAKNNLEFHVDAAQAIGKIPFKVHSFHATLVSLSAHKFYGPKGIGALYRKRQAPLKLVPQMHGGGHEKGLRSGTLATHQIVGMGEAARLALEYQGESERIKQLRDQLWQGLANTNQIRWNGQKAPLSPNHLNLCFKGIDGELLLKALPQLAISSGSACTSTRIEPSHVLTAMGLSDQEAHSSLRFSLGRFTQSTEIDVAITMINNALASLMNQSTSRTQVVLT